MRILHRDCGCEAPSAALSDFCNWTKSFQPKKYRCRYDQLLRILAINRLSLPETDGAPAQTRVRAGTLRPAGGVQTARSKTQPQR